MVLFSVVLQSNAARVGEGEGDDVAIRWTSRALVETNVLGGSVGRLVGVLGDNSILCVKVQAASSMKPMVETTLEIFMKAMLP